MTATTTDYELSRSIAPGSDNPELRHSLAALTAWRPTLYGCQAPERRAPKRGTETDVELSPAVAGFAAGHLDMQIAERLVGPRILFIPDPEAVLVELDVLGGGIAGDHTAQAAVADRQGLVLPSE